ncbi:ABC transporter ATP-binding protein [Jiangella alkaliphila]|uniref:Oligopeptide transport system ATP-binding protein n=1 Tax=Jiangella alkaliphila TaxID=419479 RepID=A0A1H2K706_9ACTN|nr:ABC transporter ATP-binding protein [Jiangella alkaliphila]SDU64126.1 oligopeptide transport system ATP-binding protein [Jiangella alkaliphila]
MTATSLDDGAAVAGVADGDEAVLEVDGLVKHFSTGGDFLGRHRSTVHAVDGVSFSIRRGETLGLVGESGCGKSTVSRLVLGLMKPTRGSIRFHGQEITNLRPRRLRPVRRDMRLVFQDPYASLNPRMTVGDIVGEPFRIHGRGREVAREVPRLLELVGLRPEHAGRFPHQFSGGQRQRIGIARALALDPSLLVLDEPVSALDVSVQAQVINLLQDLQQEFGFAVLFIAHDLALVRHISARVAVMYLGTVVEEGTGEEIYERPTHPYTQALLSAVPIDHPDQRGRGRLLLAGDPPSPLDPPSGCRFRTRCWKAQHTCADEEPMLIERPADPHRSACHFAALDPGDGAR